MIDKINRERRGHIITVEDPIEFIHRHQGCIVNQREVGTDTKSFSNALKYALREDPDVILVGEMRDLETMQAALTIAETGHLCFATLHTNSAAEAINRMIDVFPSHQQGQVRAQLAFVLEGIVTQTLLPAREGPRSRDGGGDSRRDAGDSRADPRQQDPPDLLVHAVGKEVRHADAERRALQSVHVARSVVLDECLRVSGDQNEFLRMIGEVADGRRRQWRCRRSSRDSTRSTPPRASGSKQRIGSIHANFCLHGAHAER